MSSKLENIALISSAGAGKTRALTERFLFLFLHRAAYPLDSLYGITFTNEAGDLRNVSLAALMKVKKKEIPKWSASEIGFEPSSLMDISEFYEPDLGEVDCNIISGETPEEMGRNLAKKLMEESIL